MTRAERAVEAQRLRSEGLIYREIAERMGISISYAQDLVKDPDRLKDQARKDSYCGTCNTCGARTNGNNGPGKAPSECLSCFRQRHHDERYWTKERILGAIQRWAAEHGCAPSARRWLDMPTGIGLGIPSIAITQREFGSWGAAIEAAGFRQGGDWYVTPEEMAETVRLYRSGLSGAEVGEHLGKDANTILARLAKAGEPRRSLAEAQRLRRDRVVA